MNSLTQNSRESEVLGRRLQTGHWSHTSKFWAVGVRVQNKRRGLLDRTARHRPRKPEEQETSGGIYRVRETTAWSTMWSAHQLPEVKVKTCPWRQDCQPKEEMPCSYTWPSKDNPRRAQARASGSGSAGHLCGRSVSSARFPRSCTQGPAPEPSRPQHEGSRAWLRWQACQLGWLSD